MTPEITLQHRLNAATRRVKLLVTAQWAARTLFWTMLACAIWMLCSRLAWTSEPKVSALAGLLAAAGLIGMIIGATRKISPMDVARLTDARTDLKERFSTAVELRQQGKISPIAQAQIADAGARIQKLNFRHIFPFRLTREMIGLLILAAILTGIFLLPTIPLFWSKERKQEMEEVKRQGVVLEKIAREQEKRSSDQNLTESRKAAQEMKRLAEAMRKGEVGKREAMIRMQKLTRKMEEQQKRLASANAPEKKSLEQAAQEAKQALEKRQKQIEEAIKATAAKEKANQKKPPEQQASQAQHRQGDQGSPKDQPKPSEAMQRSQQAMKEFAQAMENQDAGAQNEALQKLAEQMQQGQMSQQEMKQLQQQIKDMADALKGTSQDQVSRELQQIASQMEQQKLDPQTRQKLAEAMKKAGQTCQSCQQGSMDAKQLQYLAKALREGKLQLAQGEKMLPVNKPGQSEGQNPQGQPGKGYSPFGHVNSSQPEKRAGKLSSKPPDTKIRGQRGKPGNDPTITYRGDPERGVKSGTPYYEVYACQRSASENPVNRENIPAAYRKQVRDYFESIKP
jgi:hypothetical protein